MISIQADNAYGGDRRMRVLLVDDNAMSLRLLERLLVMRGLDIVTSTDALEAVERAGREPFDAMFVDLRMRPFGGLEVLRRTHGLVPRRYVLTGYADADEEEEALSLGASAVLHKPVEPDDLLALLRSGP